MTELEKLKNSEWRRENLYDIVDKNQQRVKFKPNIIQRAINRVKNPWKMILKARQFGVSTNEIISIFDATIWKPNQTSGIIAHEKDSITKLFRIVKRAFDFLPEEWRPVIDRGGGSKHELYFPEINSRIYCDLEIRSDTISRLLVSEAALFPNPEKLTATLQAVPLHCPVTLETTPHGIDPVFYEWWQDPNVAYSKLFFPWYVFPEYKLDQGIPIQHWTPEERKMAKAAAKSIYKRIITPEQMAFRRRKKSELRALFIQEYPEDDQSCFLSSGNAAMDLLIVSRLLKAAPKPIEETETTKYYKRREKGKLYALGCDTSEGTGLDYSVGNLFEVDNREQVAVLRVNKTKPSRFADLCSELCHEYMQPGRVLPIIGVERNNHGHAVLLELEEHIRYPNLFRARDEKLGWLTDKVSRPVMLDVFIQGVENGTVKLNDTTTLRECLTLVSNEGKIEAGTGKNDDTIMSGAIATQLCIAEGGASLLSGIGAKILV